MQKISKYTTVTAAHSYDLDRMVNDLIANGWQPFGFPCVGTPTFFMQTMVKYTEN